MNHADLVDLLRPGIPLPLAGAQDEREQRVHPAPGAQGQGEGRQRVQWADLGAGEGAFTLALAELLGPDAHITAIDKDRTALQQIGDRIETRVADFTKPLGISGLDGVVMANSLHFVRDKGPVLLLVKGMLRPGGRLIVVEYSTDRGNPWVPHPFSFQTWTRLAEAAGFLGTELLHTVPSRYFGSMYSAMSRKPET